MSLLNDRIYHALSLEHLLRSEIVRLKRVLELHNVLYIPHRIEASSDQQYSNKNIAHHIRASDSMTNDCFLALL